MNRSNVLKVVMGSPMPTEKTIDIPPKTAGEKVIEAGEIILNLKRNTPELIAILNRNNVER